MSLDVKSLCYGMERGYEDAVLRSQQSLTTAVHLVSPDGLPMSVGWFNQGARKHLVASTPDIFGLTYVPENASTAYHRLMLAQPANAEFAIFAEEVADHDLGATNDLSHVTDRRRLVQPALGDFIRALVTNTKVVDRHTARAYPAQSRHMSLPELRGYGRALWAAISDEFVINDDFLDGCAQA